MTVTEEPEVEEAIAQVEMDLTMFRPPSTTAVRRIIAAYRAAVPCIECGAKP
jgi:hypothetical protein